MLVFFIICLSWLLHRRRWQISGLFQLISFFPQIWRVIISGFTHIEYMPYPSGTMFNNAGFDAGYLSFIKYYKVGDVVLPWRKRCRGGKSETVYAPGPVSQRSFGRILGRSFRSEARNTASQHTLLFFSPTVVYLSEPISMPGKNSE
jgi:hypothetical protein